MKIKNMGINIFEFIDKTKIISFALMLIFFFEFIFVIWINWKFLIATQTIPTELIIIFIEFASFLFLFILYFYFFGDRFVLQAVKARKANPQNPKEKLLIDVVEEMSIANGIKTPNVYVVRGNDINAFIVGGDPQRCSICVTEGTIQNLDREELSSVVAHGIIRIKNYDTTIKTFIYSSSLIIILAINAFKSSESPLNILPFIILVSILVAAELISREVDRERQLLADIESVKLTNNPEALIKVLRKIEIVNEGEPSFQKAIGSLLIDTIVIFFTDPEKVDFDFLYKRISILKNL
jgi:Zn-dependent protease with chaperone function